MKEKDVPSKDSVAKEQPTPVAHPASKDATSAPEVSRTVAKQYGIHNEPTMKRTAVPAQPSGDSLAEDPAVDNPETDAAVDDIVTKEGDDLLAIQDGAVTQVPPVAKPKNRFKRFLKAWWRNKVARYITIIVLVLAIIALAVVPKTRYAILNTLGVRSSASVVVLDGTTKLPLKNVSVQLNEKQVQTNKEGVAKFNDLRLGNYTLQVKRLAFAPQKQAVTIGWGSNPLGEVALKAVGTQYEIHVKDYLSGKPLAGAEVESDGLNALSDKDGKITLTIEDTSITQLTLALNAVGYRSEQMTLDAAVVGVTDILLVPDKKAVYMSKQSGKYDVFVSDLDGKNKKLLLAATGFENDNSSLVVSPDNSRAALVSTRDNKRDKNGYALYGLTLIDVAAGTSTPVDKAEQIQLVDWIGNRLVYRSTAAGPSAASANRNKLISYNYEANTRVQLATANGFNSLISAEGYIYYAAAATDPQATLGLFRVKPDGSGRERLSSEEIWTGIRTAYETISLQTPAGWYSLDIASKKIKQGSPPLSFNGLYIATDSKGQYHVWADSRDGKGVLLLKKQPTEAPGTLLTQPGLTYPVYWAGDNAIIYRAVTSTESADYVISPNGGSPRKISDVTATHGYIQNY